MNFSQGHSATKVQCESCLFSQGKTPEFTKMGEIHELFVLALFWFGLPGRLLMLEGHKGLEIFRESRDSVVADMITELFRFGPEICNSRENLYP